MALADILDLRAISTHSNHYHGWGTVARRQTGELLVVCSGHREAHVCPYGRVELIRSADDGQTWSAPVTLADGPLDDRDSGVVESAKGTLLVTWFSSLAWEERLNNPRNDLKPTVAARWKALSDKLTDATRRAELGVFAVRSTDGGQTWSPKIDTLVNSPHGPITVRDGRLLYVGKSLWTSQLNQVAESTDDGLTWRLISVLPHHPEHDPLNYHEWHAVEAADGHLVAQVRNHNTLWRTETLQCDSYDGGHSWTTPRSIGVWGIPSHLLRLRDGRLLMTYGHRRAPLGNQARLSADHGRTWSEPIILSGDGITGDLGYPSTVELADGTLLSVWYEVRPEGPMAILRQARWRLR